jgi:hypothetical protein
VSDSYLVEIDDRAAGILVPSGSSFAFHSVSEPFAALEGREFPHVAAAEMAARKLVHGRARQSR